MLSFISVKFKIGGSVELESGNKNVYRYILYHTDRCVHDQTDTNFENNLAQKVSYNHGFKSIGGRVYKLRVRKDNMDGCVHTQNRQMDGHQFQKQPSPGGVLTVL